MTYGPRVTFDRAAFDAFRARRDTARAAVEKMMLKKVFDSCAGVPVFDAAMAWARAHGIEFIVDFESRGVHGYYPDGTGVVALARHLVDRPRLDVPAVINTLVHEIRHAWQDYHGFLPMTASSLSRATLQKHLAESDAHAMGALAEGQAKALMKRAVIAENPRAAADLSHITDAPLDDPRGFLSAQFRRWYATPRAASYGRNYRDYFGAEMGIAGYDKPAFRYEFDIQMSDVPSCAAGIDLGSLGAVESLGRMWGGGNYLTGQKMRDFLVKRALSPTAALCLFSGGGIASPSLKLEIAMKREKRKNPGFSVS